MDNNRVIWLRLTRLVKEIREDKKEEFERMIRESARKAFSGDSEDFDLPKDEHGRTVDYYTELGIDPPDDLLEETRQASRGLSYFYKDSDFIVKERKIRIPESIIDAIMESDASAKEGSSIMLSDGRVFFLKETVEQIDKIIEQCQSI